LFLYKKNQVSKIGFWGWLWERLCERLWEAKLQGMVAVGDVVVVVVVRQSAGYDAMRGVKFYLFGSL